jgi:hypothetical protein
MPGKIVQKTCRENEIVSSVTGAATEHLVTYASFDLFLLNISGTYFRYF